MNIPWDLIDGHLDDALSDEEAEALRRWIAQDRGHLRVLARAARDHAALADHFRRHALEEGSPARRARPEPILRLPAVRWAALALAAPPDGTGALLRETWFDVIGLTVADLLAHPAFPDSPSARDYPAGLETAEGGAGHDLYGSRWRGYLHVPVSGSYTFWIAADDAADLYLSPDDRPETRRLIARVPTYTMPREWTKFAEQQSVAVHLEAGQRCFIEVLHKEQAGGDHLAVAWQLPGGEAEVISGAYLSPFQP